MINKFFTLIKMTDTIHLVISAVFSISLVVLIYGAMMYISLLMMDLMIHPINDMSKPDDNSQQNKTNSIKPKHGYNLRRRPKHRPAFYGMVE